MPDRGTCKSCGEPVLWMATSTGGRMPVDAEPVADGNCRLDLEHGVVEVLGRKAIAEARANKERLHKSHFATCSSGARHRKHRPRGPHK